MSKLLSMIKSKPRYLYATIKGTLTENDGVFSGFSTSNYLTLQQTFGNINSFEIVLRVKVSTSGANGFFGASNGQDKQGIALQIGTDNKLKYYLSSNGTSWNIGTGTGTTVFALDTFYYIKVKFTGTQYIISSSTDGINWVIEKTITSSLMIYIPNEPYNIGYNIYTSGSQQYFRGSIDLNNSYIKLGATKYNLQAVYGYKIVGTLTESPTGVFSGFSGRNYINIPYAFPFLSSNNWKIIIKATTTYNGNQQRLINGSMIRGIGNPMRWCFYLSSNNDNWLSGILLEDYPYFKIERKENTIYLSASVDGITWSNPQTTDLTDLTNSSFIRFGQNSSNMWTGLLYLKDCLIYNQNKLWFNGYEG